MRTYRRGSDDRDAGTDAMSAITALLQHVDDDVGVDGSAGGAHRRTVDLMIDRAVEMKIAVRHDEREQLHDEFGVTSRSPSVR